MTDRAKITIANTQKAHMASRLGCLHLTLAILKVTVEVISTMNISQTVIDRAHITIAKTEISIGIFIFDLDPL